MSVPQYLGLACQLSDFFDDEINVFIMNVYSVELLHVQREYVVPLSFAMINVSPVFLV